MRFFCSKKRILRLRVVGNSDAPIDQVQKLSVRDAVLPVAKRRPNDLSAILHKAHAIDPSARVCRGEFCFGGYMSDAIVVTLGKGEGQNWWGILFPSALGVADEPVQFESWFVRLLRGWGWI